MFFFPFIAAAKSTVKKIATDLHHAKQKKIAHIVQDLDALHRAKQETLTRIVDGVIGRAPSGTGPIADPVSNPVTNPVINPVTDPVVTPPAKKPDDKQGGNPAVKPPEKTDGSAIQPSPSGETFNPYLSPLDRLAPQKQVEFMTNLKNQAWFEHLHGNDKVMASFDSLPVEYRALLNRPVRNELEQLHLGTGGDDRMTGSRGDDDMVGYEGNDVMQGGAGNDRIFGGNGNDQIEGGEGNDVLYGEAGDDVITDQSGDNVIFGGDGNDRITGRGIMVGGQGDDVITGSGSADDTYVFHRGDGKDTISDRAVDGSQSNKDVLIFREGIAQSQLWFSKKGEDLDITLVGSTEGVLIKDWYQKDANGAMRNQIETIELANGKRLSHTQVDALVQKMAAFSVPVSGQSTLPDATLAALNPLLATSWK